MNLNFEQLCDDYMIMFLIIEGLQYSVLRKLNSNVIAISKREPNSNRAKLLLKPLAKDLILHITNGNFENITDDFLPNLKNIRNKKSDLTFKPYLEKELSNLPVTDYTAFWRKINELVLKISSRNNSEFEHLKKLRPQYIMSY